MYVVRKNSLALPHCEENDCKQYFFHSQHFQSLSFSTLKRPKSEKKTVEINQKGHIIAGLSLSDLAIYLLLIDRRLNVHSSNCFWSIEPLPKTSYGLPLI